MTEAPGVEAASRESVQNTRTVEVGRWGFWGEETDRKEGREKKARRQSERDLGGSFRLNSGRAGSGFGAPVGRVLAGWLCLPPGVTAFPPLGPMATTALEPLAHALESPSTLPVLWPGLGLVSSAPQPCS